MTEKDIDKLIEKNLKSNPNPMIATETGLAALARLAGSANIQWALVAAGLQRWYDLADGRITTEKEDYEAGRL